MGLENLLSGEGFLTTTVNSIVNWGRKNALWPMPFGTACCAIEMMATFSGRYDISRFGAEVVRFSPRQADLLIVSGRISLKMMPVLQKIYRQMPEPKWVISMGACASCALGWNIAPVGQIPITSILNLMERLPGSVHS